MYSPGGKYSFFTPPSSTFSKSSAWSMPSFGLMFTPKLGSVIEVKPDGMGNAGGTSSKSTRSMT